MTSIFRLDNISTFNITRLSYCQAHFETLKTLAMTCAADNDYTI